jgi:hypothetical protein
MQTMKNRVTPTSSRRGRRATRTSCRADESHQQQRLTGRGVRPHLGAAAEQNQRFANRLDDGVADQQDEYVDQHQHRRGPFTGTDVGEQRKGAVQQRFLSTGCFESVGSGHCVSPQPLNATMAKKPRNPLCAWPTERSYAAVRAAVRAAAALKYEQAL